MKKLQKCLALSLALLMLISLLSACGGQTAEPETDAPETAAPAVEPEPGNGEEPPAPPEGEPEEVDNMTVALPISDEEITLTYWTTLSPMFADLVTTLDGLLLWEELASMTNIRIDGMLVSPQSGQEQFNLMVNGGDYADLMDSPGSNYATGLQGAMDDDVIMDLTDVVEQYMPNYGSIIHSNEQYRQGTCVDDGRLGMIYGLKPENYKPTEGPIIRQDWLDALGLDTPVTYNDLHDVLAAFKENYGATMWIPYSGSPLGHYLGAGFGVATTYLTHMSGREPFYQVDGEVKFGPMEDEYFEYLKMLNEWYEEGLIWDDFFSYTERFNTPPEAGVLNGQFGVWFGSNSNFQMWTANAEDPNFHVVAFADPVMNAGDTNHLRAESFLVTQAGVGISTKCEYLEETAKLLDFGFSEEGRFFMTFGIEGTTYELDADGHPQYTDLIMNNPDGLPQMRAEALYLFGISLPTVEHPLADFLETGETEDQKAAPDIWTATSDDAYCIPNTVSLTVEEASTNATVLSDVGTYVSPWMIQAIIGEQDITDESIAAFRSTLTEQLNIDQVIANKQAALDRYNNR